MAHPALRGPKSQHRQTNRAIIHHLLRSGALIRTITTDATGSIEVSAVEWDEYWADVLPDLAAKHVAQLSLLKAVRARYIESDYDLSLAAPYCQTYFALLREWLSAGQSSAVLRSLLGLECFTITQHHDPTARAAGALTLRHPVYLLAKLREPEAYDDVKFLPLVCPKDADESSKARLFYWYRQVKIQDDPPTSLLMYPALALAYRAGSFSCLDALSFALSLKPDPRARQRADAITNWAVVPFLAHEAVSPHEGHELSFVDIGGGSAALLSEICKKLIADHTSLMADRKFSWSIVDVCAQDATRRTHSSRLRQHMAYIDCQPVDYATWVMDEASRDHAPRYDVALICRLLNNLSQFEIESSASPDVIGQLTSLRNRPASLLFHPADCLPEAGCGSQSLVASNARARLCGGTTFRQASLSDYFRGLSLLQNPARTTAGMPASLYFPIRRFNPAALLLPDGRSLFDRLSQLANLIVIEDVDLTGDILKNHLRESAMHHLAASDATDRVRMQSASLFCVTRRACSAALPGRRLW